MVKTLSKLFATIVGIISIIFLQLFIRYYLPIDERIRFFVHCGVLILNVSVIFLFYKELEIFISYLRSNSQSSFLVKCMRKLRSICMSLSSLIYLSTAALLFFNFFYPDTYNNHMWMKIITFILLFLSSLDYFSQYRNERSNLLFICSIGSTICLFQTFVTILISVI